MSREVQHPVTVDSGSPNGGTETSHPAFAQISASRVSGRASLYGSDFVHNGYITIRITKSLMMRDLNHDWAFERDRLIEVDLSYAQWAEFVSNMNSGAGVQCTLDRVNNKAVPGLPDPQTRQAQSIAEQQKDFTKLLTQLEESKAAIEALNISQKAKSVMLEQLWKVHREVTDSLPFALKSFNKHLEDTVEKAKIEVNAYVESRIHRAGLDAIAAQIEGKTEPPILFIDAPRKDACCDNEQRNINGGCDNCGDPSY